MATGVFTLHCSLYIVSLGTCGLDWYPAHPTIQRENPLHDEKLSLVFLLHGLNNSARSYYIQHAMRVFAEDGKSKRFFCCSFNMRQILIYTDPIPCILVLPLCIFPHTVQRRRWSCSDFQIRWMHGWLEGCRNRCIHVHTRCMYCI
jgi:hypothetical protein